jgi:alpha 1,3-mannosyltransferase
VDEKDKLVRYNRSLLKNKAVDNKDFQVPSHWMVDAEWVKGGTECDRTCIKGGKCERCDWKREQDPRKISGGCEGD